MDITRLKMNDLLAAAKAGLDPVAARTEMLRRQAKRHAKRTAKAGAGKSTVGEDKMIANQQAVIDELNKLIGATPRPSKRAKTSPAEAGRALAEARIAEAAA